MGQWDIEEGQDGELGWNKRMKKAVYIGINDMYVDIEQINQTVVE